MCGGAAPRLARGAQRGRPRAGSARPVRVRYVTPRRVALRYVMPRRAALRYITPRRVALRYVTPRRVAHPPHTHIRPNRRRRQPPAAKERARRATPQARLGIRARASAEGPWPWPVALKDRAVALKDRGACAALWCADAAAAAPSSAVARRSSLPRPGRGHLKVIIKGAHHRRFVPPPPALVLPLSVSLPYSRLLQPARHRRFVSWPRQRVRVVTPVLFALRHVAAVSKRTFPLSH